MGQIIVELPEAVLEAAKQLAEQANLSVEEYISRMVVEVIEERQAWQQLVERGRRGSRERFEQALAEIRDVPPDEYDGIE